MLQGAGEAYEGGASWGAGASTRRVRAFTNGFISAVRENRIAWFHAEHRKLDLLCIDDVHFLTNKNATQGEGFYAHCCNSTGWGTDRDGV